MDKYGNFRELKRHEREGTDYEIRVRKGSSGIAVIAPHGGGIEPGTLDIADKVAGKEHTFYSFKGKKKSGNADLHITSDKFDEPEGIQIAERADLVLATHGCIGKTHIIFVGGKDHDFRRILLNSISRAGFSTRESERAELRGRRSANICNRGRSRKGGQVEITESLLNLVEMAWRPYDPCFACATHALPGQLPLEVTIYDAQGNEVKRLSRNIS